MKIKEIVKILDDWAPPGAAWDKDNVGLQVGSLEKEVQKIFLCLELTENTLNEAISKNCNLIITHHPLIFQPVKKLNVDSNPQARVIAGLIKNDITLLSYHTNLDFSKDGVSFELAKRLSLINVQFLKHSEANQFKLVVFVLKESAKVVADAIFKAGGGVLGEYAGCSFNSPGVGTFIGSERSNPVIGGKLNSEKVDEVRLEVLVHEWKLRDVIAALRKAHPYEEPAFDIYPLKNENPNYGFGAIGTMNPALAPEKFLELVKEKLQVGGLRYTLGRKKIVERVAVCGGAGSDLLQEAINQKADAFITADVKYHAFEDAEKQIMLIDAGHYETEVPILDAVKEKLEAVVSVHNISVVVAEQTTNPIQFYY